MVRLGSLWCSWPAELTAPTRGFHHGRMRVSARRFSRFRLITQLTLLLCTHSLGLCSNDHKSLARKPLRPALVSRRARTISAPNLFMEKSISSLSSLRAEFVFAGDASSKNFCQRRPPRLAERGKNFVLWSSGRVVTQFKNQRLMRAREWQ